MIISSSRGRARGEVSRARLHFWKKNMKLIRYALILIGCLTAIIVGLITGWAGIPVVEHLMRGDRTF